MHAKPSVKNLTIDRLTVETGDPIIDALLPDKNIREHARIEIHNINNAIANALRRAALMEISVRTLTFAGCDLTTDNPFILVDMIQRRIRLIPIAQSTDTKRKFSLHVRNTTQSIRSVYSREIIAADGGELPFNSTFELFTLDSGQYLDINEITVDSGYGYVDAVYAVCFHGVTVPLDIEPYNEFSGEGVSCSVSSPVNYAWSFDTNGTISPQQIMLLAVQNVTSRVQAVLGAIGEVIANQDLYTITIANESATIGNLIMKNTLAIYPNIPYISFVSASIGRSIDIKIRTPDDISVLLENVVKHTVDILADIEAQLRGF